MPEGGCHGPLTQKEENIKMMLEEGKNTSMMDRIWLDLDRFLAVLGLFASLVLILYLSLSVGKYVEVAFMLFSACAIYLFMKKRHSAVSTFLSRCARTRSPTCITLAIAFFLVFTYSMVSIALRPEPHSRPLGYFVSTALMATIVVSQVLSLPSRKSWVYLLLFQIMLLGISLRFTVQLMFPGVVGIDPWWHQMFTDKMLELGHIPEGYGYSRLPIMHLAIGSTSLMTGLSYPIATMLSVSMMQVVIFALFTFLLGRFLLNDPKVGLLGALVIMIVPGVLALGFASCPTSLGLIWMLLIIYMLFRARGKRSSTVLCISLLLMGVLILSHTVAALAMAILLFCFWVAFRIYRKAKRVRFHFPVGLTLSIFFTVAMLSWWIYASGHITDFAELIRWGFRIDRWTLSMEAIRYAQQIAYSEYLLNNLGFLLFYTFALIGSLYMLSPGPRNRYLFAMVLGGFVFTAVAFFSLAMNLTGVLTHRWFYFSQLVMAVPAVLGLILTSGLPSNKLISRGLLLALVFVTSFLLITNSGVNRDNPIYAENLTARTAFTSSELQGLDAISHIWEGKVAVVYPDVYYFRFNKGMPTIELAPYLSLKNFSDCRDTMVIIREETTQHPFHTSGGNLKLDYDPRQALEEEGFSRVYDSGSVTGFLFIE